MRCCERPVVWAPIAKHRAAESVGAADGMGFAHPELYNLSMSEMPISDAREHLGEVVGRARYGGEETILTHYGAPAAVVIGFEEYQRLKHARDDSGVYQLPPEITAQIAEGRRHPERRQPRPRRASRDQS
jgi:prevent-host-death family protein